MFYKKKKLRNFLQSQLCILVVVSGRGWMNWNTSISKFCCPKFPLKTGFFVSQTVPKEQLRKARLATTQFSISIFTWFKTLVYSKSPLNQDCVQSLGGQLGTFADWCLFCLFASIKWKRKKNGSKYAQKMLTSAVWKLSSMGHWHYWLPHRTCSSGWLVCFAKF